MTMTEHRTIDLIELARVAGSVEGEIEAVGLARLSTMLAAPMGRIRYRLEGRIDERGRPGAILRITGLLGLQCDRCGGRFEWALDESDGFFFVDTEEQLGAAPIAPDGDEPLLASRRFDVQDLVEEQTILALPISPRHPACELGTPAEPDPADAGRRPFAVLESLKRGRKDIQ
jgi:DUF177 domain-containing protein